MFKPPYELHARIDWQIRPILGFWEGGFWGSNVPQNERFPAEDADVCITVQYLMPLVLSWAEKSVTVQSNTHTRTQTQTVTAIYLHIADRLSSDRHSGQ